MGRCHYVLVDGTPQLGTIPTPEVETTQLAMEGMRCYDEWRHGPAQEESAPTENEGPPQHDPSPESVVLSTED